MRIGGFGDGWTPKTSIFPQISPKSLQNIARKWAFLVNALKKCFFHPNLPHFPPIFAQNLRILDGENVEFWRFPPKKKKMIFFYHIKKWYFRPISTHFCPISPPLERICQKKWSFASGFRGPKIGLFSPHFLPLFTAEGPKRGKKGSENFGWETPKNPILTEGLQEGIFLGWKKAFLGGPFFARFRARKTRWENGDFGGFCPNFGGRGWKKMGVLRKRPQNGGGIWGNFVTFWVFSGHLCSFWGTFVPFSIILGPFGAIGDIWGKFGSFWLILGKFGKIGGETEKMVKNGGNDPKMREIGSKSGRIGWSRLKMW